MEDLNCSMGFKAVDQWYLTLTVASDPSRPSSMLGHCWERSQNVSCQTRFLYLRSWKNDSTTRTSWLCSLVDNVPVLKRTCCNRRLKEQIEPSCSGFGIASCWGQHYFWLVTHYQEGLDILSIHKLDPGYGWQHAFLIRFPRVIQHAKVKMTQVWVPYTITAWTTRWMLLSTSDECVNKSC